MEENAKQAKRALIRYKNIVESKPDILWVPVLVTTMADKLKAGKIGKNYFTSPRGFSFFQKKLDQLDNIIRLFQDMESNRARLPDKPGGKAKSIKSASARLYAYLGDVKACDTSADSSKNLVKNYLDRVEKKLKTVQQCFLTYFKNSTKPKKQATPKATPKTKPAMWSPSPEKGKDMRDREIDSLFDSASEEVFSDEEEEEEPKVTAEEKVEEEEDSTSATDMSVDDDDMVDEVESSDSDVMVSTDEVKQNSGLTYSLYVLEETGPKKITIGHFKTGRAGMEWGRKMYPNKFIWTELESLVFKNSDI